MSPALELVDLRRLAGPELDPLLLEETVEWQRELDWDFGRSAELVRHFTESKGLMGAALLDRGEVVGYSYSVVEDQKGMIGDVYVRPGWRDGRNELVLLRSALDRLVEMPQVRRVESQLMLTAPEVGAELLRERFVAAYERVLMSRDSTEPVPVSRRPTWQRYRFETWGEHLRDAAAGVIAGAYEGHVDSQVNDQYRSLDGARRFVHNITQYPGCGEFFRQGSMVAFDLETGWLAGLILVSFVGAETGHITQVCVTPQAKGSGLGYELMRQALQALRMHRARRVTLSVTSANSGARQLYESCGFQEAKRFFAYAWDRPGQNVFRPRRY